MWARKRIDISWLDLAKAAGFLARSTPKMRPSSACNWPAVEATYCLSVRTALDLWLTAKGFARGSEILFSAITIADMVRIAEQHSLTAVPIDFNVALQPDVQQLKRLVTPRTKAIVLAHLFGSVIPMQTMDEISLFAEQNDLVIFEDCAQGFQGIRYCGHDGSDAVAFSFGPIKTATALGGAILQVRDPDVRAAVRTIQAAWPQQSRWSFAKRVARYSLLKLLGYRLSFRILTFLWSRCGRDIDQQLGSMAKNFGGQSLFEGLRKRPSAPQLHLLNRRVSRFDSQQQKQKLSMGLRFAHQIGNPCLLACSNSERRNFWVLAVRSQQPRQLVATLRRAGFDATQRSSLGVVDAPDGFSPAVQARNFMDEIVFLPLYPEMPLAEVKRMAGIVRKVEDTQDSPRFMPRPLRPKSSASVADEAVDAAMR